MLTYPLAWLAPAEAKLLIVCAAANVVFEWTRHRRDPRWGPVALLSVSQLGFGCMLIVSREPLPQLLAAIVVFFMLVQTAMLPFEKRSDARPSRVAVVKVSLGLLYGVSAIIVPLFFVRRYLPEHWWWAAGLAAEFAAIGVPLAAVLLAPMRHGPVKPGWLGRFAMLLTLLVGVIFLAIVMPCAIVAFGTDASSATVSGIWMLCTLGIITVLWAFSRYYWLPRRKARIERTQAM